MLCSDPRQHESVVPAPVVNFRANKKYFQISNTILDISFGKCQIVEKQNHWKDHIWSRYILSHVAEASQCFIFSVLKQAWNLKWRS